MNISRVWVCVGLLVGLLGSTALAVNIETVLVGDPGNSADMRYELLERPEGYGRVDYAYRIGKYEVTAGQYCEFLNAVAKVDTYGLYHWAMSDTDYYEGCNIQRDGSSGYYTYSVASDWANRPVNWVSWGDAARFANWLHNGQPSGSQNLSTTEDGTYFLNGAVTNAALLAVTRKENATWAIASEDEWYKAAYYDPAKPGGAGYWDFATRSNASPSNVLDPNGTNNANYYDSTGYTIGAPYYRTEVGAFVGSRSFAGTFDQAGNVWEWNETVWYDVEPVLRGGCYAIMDAVMLSASYRNHIPPTRSYWSIGFRVVQALEADSDGDAVPDSSDNCPDTANSDQADADEDGIGDACDSCPLDALNDADGDGICGDQDICADSDLTATIVIDGCDTGVTNALLPDGCTMADKIAELASSARNHGEFVSGVAHLTNGWKNEGLITGQEKGRIQACAAHAAIPGSK